MKRLCDDCRMPLLATEGSKGKPIWLCSICNKSIDRETLGEAVSSFMYSAGELSPLIIIVCLVAAFIAAWVEGSAECARIKTYIVFFHPFCNDKLSYYLERDGKIDGVHQDVLGTDFHLGFMKIKTSYNLLSEAAKDAGITIDSYREAKQGE